MTIGDKIKIIRNFRNMKQKELGLALGFSESTADNRIAQYETNYRVPKKDALLKIAEILNVNSENFVTVASGSATDILFTFFWLEEGNKGMINLFQMVRNEGKTNSSDDTSVRYNDNDDYPSKPPVGMYFNYGLVNDFMSEWLLRKEQLKSGKITKEQYFEWKLQFPSSCGKDVWW
ncbi:MAG: helix-turn-helix transcriptional regulator [Eubacteriales bacterium]